jgi:hypothetical protein
MKLAIGAYHSAGRVTAVDVTAGHCSADAAAGVLARSCVADGLAVGSVAGWATVVAESEFQCLKKEKDVDSIRYSVMWGLMACQIRRTTRFAID